MLLKFGVTYQEFDRVCRAAFVKAATDEFGSQGKAASVSRVALLTGLTRKAVRRIQDMERESSVPEPDIRSLPSEALHVWHTDSRFCEAIGVPRVLALDSGADSFSDLVRECSGTVSSATMRDELVRVGAVRESPDGFLIATRRSYIPSTTEERLINGLHYGLRPLAMTIAHNTTSNEPSSFRFQRIVWNFCLPKWQRQAMDQLISHRLEEFSQEMDDLLSEGEHPGKPDELSVFGVGLYHFEDDPNDFNKQLGS